MKTFQDEKNDSSLVFRCRIIIKHRLAWFSVCFAASCFFTTGDIYAQDSGARLGALLEKIADEYDTGGEAAAKQLALDHGMRLSNDPYGILVPVILEPPAGFDATSIDPNGLLMPGIQLDAVSRSFVRLLVRPSLLWLLEKYPGVEVARAPTPAKVLLGPNLSESVQLTGADAMHTAGITGTGVKLGIVDLGFIGLSARISEGELPTDTVAVDLPGTNDDNIESQTKHGVGVAEHAADMAPDAQIYCLMVGDEVDLQNAADYVRDNGIAIANHSVAWVNASYYDDTGPINDIINTSRDVDGVFWTVAAGNQANRHWRSISWQDDGNNWFNFTPEDEVMTLTTSSTQIQVFLNWDQYGNSVTDLDLYLFDKNLNLVASSVGVQNGPQDPAEAIGVTLNVREHG